MSQILLQPANAMITLENVNKGKTSINGMDNSINGMDNSMF